MSTAPTTTTPAAPPAVSSPKKDFRELVESEKFKAQIAAALPAHITPARFIRVLLTAAIRTPDLMRCTQESVFKCVFDCAASGLEPDGRRAHLIPFKNNRAGTYECTLIYDYKGLAELAMRSGVVSSIHADIVCENDVFEEDRGQVVAHKINRREARGAMYAAYCLIRMKDGTEKAEVLSRFEVEDIRNRSQGYQAFVKGFTKSNPWDSDPGEMWKKTAARRAFKWVPLSPEVREAIERDDEPRAPINVTPPPLNLAALLTEPPPEAAETAPETASTEATS